LRYIRRGEVGQRDRREFTGLHFRVACEDRLYPGSKVPKESRQWPECLRHSALEDTSVTTGF